MQPGARMGSFDTVDAEQPFPGVLRQTFTTERATVSRYTFSPHAEFPLHRHPQEQITLVEAGAVEMSIGGERRRLGAGSWSVVPGEIEHGITALGDGARIVAVVSPPRRGPDAYELAAGPE